MSVPTGFGIIFHQRVDNYLRYDHIKPTKISIYFVGQTAGETPVVAICIPSGAVVSPISNWKAVLSRAELDAAPYSSAWNQQGVYWHNTANGWLYTRAFSRNGWLPLEVTLTGGSGPGNWCTPSISGRTETRTLPPVNAAGVPTPVAWTPPVAATFPRDLGQCGTVVATPCTVDNWSSWSTCVGSCGGSGTTTRNRVVLTPGSDCPELSQSSVCTMPACPVNGGLLGLFKSR